MAPGDKGRSTGRGSTTTRSPRGRDDRPYLVALLGLLVVIAAMAIGPLRSLSAANDRVDELTRERDVLAEEVDGLEDKRDDLNDPAEQEVYAREQLGLVRPGEVPYVVLPDPESGAAGDGEPGTAGEGGAESTPWYRRLAEALTALFGG